MNITIYSKKPRRIGERIKLEKRDGSGKSAYGTIIRHMADETKYQNHHACGIATPINSGKGYYEVQLD